jgi:AcrR family transcriptional regulator
MGRWEPDARGRLERAAMELYGQRGYERTTVAEISVRAGLTERTFFRYFADKREVLFWGAGALQAFLVDSVETAPSSLSPMQMIIEALCASGDDIFEPRRGHARQRHAIIIANPELQERELIKLARLAASLADALRGRGVGDPTAALAAEIGIAAFRIAFESWVDDVGDRQLSTRIRLAVEELGRLVGLESESAH